MVVKFTQRQPLTLIVDETLADEVFQIFGEVLADRIDLPIYFLDKILLGGGFPWGTAVQHLVEDDA